MRPARYPAAFKKPFQLPLVLIFPEEFLGLLGVLELKILLSGCIRVDFYPYQVNVLIPAEIRLQVGHIVVIGCLIGNVEGRGPYGLAITALIVLYQLTGSAWCGGGHNLLANDPHGIKSTAVALERLKVAFVFLDLDLS